MRILKKKLSVNIEAQAGEERNHASICNIFNPQQPTNMLGKTTLYSVQLHSPQRAINIMHLSRDGQLYNVKMQREVLLPIVLYIAYIIKLALKRHIVVLNSFIPFLKLVTVRELSPNVYVRFARALHG